MPEPARPLDTTPTVPALEVVPPRPSDVPRDPEQLPLLRMLEVVRDRVESIHAGQRTIAEELRTIKTSLPMQRRPLSKRTQAIHLHATLTRRNGLCPCCQETPIVTDAGKLPGAEFDHFYSRDKNKVGATWCVCESCNGRLIDTDFRAAARSAFEAYQAALKPLLGKPVQIGLLDERG